MEERERLQAEFKEKSELEKDALKSTWIEKIDNTDQVISAVILQGKHLRSSKILLLIAKHVFVGRDDFSEKRVILPFILEPKFFARRTCKF